ncbi:unnamed protein product [Phaeothamnion confervicola]
MLATCARRGRGHAAATWTRKPMAWSMPCRSGVNSFAAPTRPAPATIPWATMGHGHGAGGGAPAFRAPVLHMPAPLQSAAAAAAAARAVVRSLHGTMTAPRRIHVLGVPLTTNISDLCGHGSFVALAMGYLETDVLLLRGYAMGGVVLSVLFQYYRPQPLWLPISWNGAFLLINLVMIALLLDERRGATNLDDEQTAVFEGVFAKLGLTPVDFVKLVRLADRRRVATGAPLAREGVRQEEMYMIIGGDAEVSSEGDHVADLRPYQFVGSMAFLRFCNAADDADADAAAAAAAAKEDGDDGAVGAEDEDSGGHSGSGHGREHFIAAAAAAASASIDAMEGGEDCLNLAAPAAAEIAAVAAVAAALRRASASSSGAAAGGGGGAGSSVGGGASSSGESDDHPHLPHPPAAGELVRHGSCDVVLPRGCERLSTTTVRARSDMLVYAWDFHLLRAYLRRHPESAAAMQTSLSADLTRKVDQSRHSGERYRVLLHNMLSYGEVTPLEKKKLERFRAAHGISPSEHLAMLTQCGWTTEEFAMGFRLSTRSSAFAEYDAAVAAAVAGRDDITPAERTALRRQRMSRGVDPEEHILALNHHGWSADEYEEGHRRRRRATAAAAPGAAAAAGGSGPAGGCAAASRRTTRQATFPESSDR